MKNYRIYGSHPFNTVVVHGGPGAPGEMAPVAKELAASYGILEPLQTKTSLEGQVQELKYVIEQHSTAPVNLVGYSWGAWLSFIIAARYPELVSKLILVSSGPFEAHYANNIMKTRLSRLSEAERQQVQLLLKAMSDPHCADRDEAFAHFGQLLGKADTYDHLEITNAEPIECQSEVFQNVWQEANQLRQNGELLSLAAYIQCPVVAIHGDYDPHPAEGVRQPLSRHIKDFRFILLAKCGHEPWAERQAKDNFFSILKQELC